ncbi:hypothetical protein JW848_10470, partial [Candidatus Bipolaricaulota bacterium]|nr:hypothetical protein [Candidatus Bipolaricaulota bacterium]
MSARVWLVVLGLFVAWTSGLCAEAVIESSIAFTDQVNVVAIDQEGRIWMGTAGGVVRWDTADDPASYVHWTAADGLPDNWVSDIVVAPDGRVWVALATWLGGVSTLVDGVWITFDDHDGLTSNFVRDLAVDEEGNLWAATANGLCVLTPMADSATGMLGATITTLVWDGDPTASRLQGVAVDVRGRVWLWQGWGNVVVLDPNGTPHDPADDVWTAYAPERLAFEPPIEQVVPDPWGRVWITHRSNGAVVFDDGGTRDPGDDKTAEYLAGEGLPRDATCFLAFDPSGRLWVPTSQGDLHVLIGAQTPFDRSDDILGSVPVAPGFPRWGFRGLAIGSDDDVWVIAGTREGAIRLQHEGTIEDGSDDLWERFLARSDLASHDVRGFAFFEDQAWIASDSGLVVRTAEGWQEALSASIYGIASQGPVVWAGTWGGLFALELVDGEIISANYRAEQGLADNYVQAVAVDPVGRVWCGLPNAGVSVLDHAGTPHDPTDDRWVLLTHGTLVDGYGVSAIGFQGARRVWFALGEDGAIALDHGGTLEDPFDDIWVRYDTSTGMPSGGAYAVLVGDDGIVWLGGCSNVVAVDPGTDFAD